MRDRRTLSRAGPAFRADEVPRLLRKLADPAERQEAGGRRLASGDAALPALLEEIDETVMARRLVVSNAAGEEIALHVCNRRLLAVGPVEGAALPASATHTLTYAGIGDLAALQARLAAFVAPGEVRVRTDRPNGAATLEQTGVAVTTLRQAWGLGSGGALRAACSFDFSAFCDAVTEFARAGAIQPDGQPPIPVGALDAAGRLADILAESASLLRGSSPEALLLAGEGAAPTLLLARDVDGKAAFALPQGALPETSRLWAAFCLP